MRFDGPDVDSSFVVIQLYLCTVFTYTDAVCVRVETSVTGVSLVTNLTISSVLLLVVSSLKKRFRLWIGSLTFLSLLEKSLLTPCNKRWLHKVLNFNVSGLINMSDL